ncbi:unnamed protein product [Meloidogyne enterolobii]|uniref:Uncharacterized protein n=1 Tax=Meloidogyne enterolobii TaxID=390850 RepID=A0ACB0Z6W6_MELEN
MFPRRSRSKTPGGNAKEGLYVQTFKPLPSIHSKQRINVCINFCFVYNRFYYCLSFFGL